MTKICKCPCKRLIIRKDNIDNGNWKRQKYFDAILCKRAFQMQIAKKKRKAIRTAKEKFQRGFVNTSTFWQKFLCKYHADRV